MANQPEPIDLIVFKGKKHLTKKEIEDRKNSELNVPFIDVKPPKYLNRTQKTKFKDIADKLLALNIMTELDVDCLARYILAQDLYLQYTKELNAILEESTDFSSLKQMQDLQDKAFKQAHTAARALGLTITDRCKIVVPSPPDDDDDEL